MDFRASIRMPECHAYVSTKGGMIRSEQLAMRISPDWHLGITLGACWQAECYHDGNGENVAHSKTVPHSSHKSMLNILEDSDYLSGFVFREDANFAAPLFIQRRQPRR